jgi:CheY-like chemotaxis protein
MSDDYVLVIDDDADLRESIGMMLEVAGHSFTLANDGLDGLQRLRTGRPPCVVLLDLMMPRMSGFELRSLMKADPQLSAIPVIVVTGAGPLADRRAAELDAEILRKPVEVQVLLDAVNRRCNRAAPAGM